MLLLVVVTINTFTAVRRRIRLLVAVDVPDAGYGLEPRRYSRRSPQNGIHIPYPHSFSFRRRRRAGQLRGRGGVVAERLLLDLDVLVRRAGQVRHAGLVEGAVPAVAACVAGAGSVIVMAASDVVVVAAAVPTRPAEAAKHCYVQSIRQDALLPSLSKIRGDYSTES